MSIQIPSTVSDLVVPVPEPDASHTTIPLEPADDLECGAHSFARDIAAHLHRLIREPVTGISYRLNPWHRRLCPAASFTDITIAGHQVRITAWTSYANRHYDDTTYAITLDGQALPFRRLPVDDLAAQLARTIWLHHLDLPGHEHPHPSQNETPGTVPGTTPTAEPEAAPGPAADPETDLQQRLLDAVTALVRQFVPQAARIYLQTSDTLGEGFFLTDVDTHSGRSLTALDPQLLDRLSDDLWRYLNPLAWDGVADEDDYGVARLVLPDTPVPDRTVWFCMTCGYESDQLSADRDRAHVRFDGAHPAAWYTQADLTGRPATE
ncbi:hypothetical protein [Kineosporia sp. NBRC 101731]|uniref:hypothetical protein n=1 Tax=Kineosporia sp. NBRC 101731 TaxID=3032199 RepID=UPI0024A09316|nr:hypothetical protein [Kineosporia sp. NBRC 101731]GLY33420.1 hypothetical protein Kisp02_67850 [Kineosporia sp. NBRC 101731]